MKIPWVSKCEYNPDKGIALKLNEELKPFLINLKDHYTQYTLQDVLAMKSVYAIRIFELLQSRIMTKILPKEGVYIDISVIEHSREMVKKSMEYREIALKDILTVGIEAMQEEQLFCGTFDEKYMSKTIKMMSFW